MSELFFGCAAILVVAYLLIAPGAALVFALRARREAAALRARLEVLGAVSAPERAATTAASRAPEPAVEPETEVTAPLRRPAPPAAVPPAAPPPVATPEPRVEAPGRPEEPPAPVSYRAPAPAAPRPPKPGLEERLGARLPVWLGAIALALAGAFLVQYSVERGWLSPAVRVVLALLFGVALLAGGQALSRKSARIAQALSAAGIADLYAALFAAARLYELIPAGVAFALMAANTAVAVLLALRQGPMPAVLGLVGGFLTPALVSTGERNVAGLVAYLFLLDLGLVAVTRRRRWPALAAAALGASLLWVAVWLGGAYRAGDGVVLGLFLVASSALFAGLALRPEPDGAASWGSLAAARAIALAAGAGGLALLAAVVGRSGYGWGEWALFGLLGAGCLALARLREEEHFALAPLAAGVSFLLLALWGFDLGARDETRFLAVAAVATALWAGGAYGLGFGARRPGRWGLLAAAALLAFPLLAALSVEGVPDPVWAGLFAILAALAVGACLPLLARRPAGGAEVDLALAAVAAAATAGLSLALAFALEREWLSVALALEVPALVAIGGRLALPALGRFALAVAGIAAVRLLLNPEVLDYPIGATPISNLLLWGYGVPAASFLVAARLARAQAQEARGRQFEWGGVGFAAAGVTLEVWHALLPEAPERALADLGLLAWSAQTAAWLLGGLVLLAVARRRPAPAFALGGRIALGAGALAALAVHGLAENPAWASFEVGATPVWNLLLVAFGMPALLLVLGTRELALPRERWLAVALRGAALALAFLWATLEVRHAFRGSDLAAGASSAAERFAYSAAWALFGTALLVAGVVRRNKGLRFAALAVMLLAVLKVFLLDASGLTGLYRVASFLGLGASLLLLAWLYQRFVFRAEEPA